MGFKSRLLGSLCQPPKAVFGPDGRLLKLQLLGPVKAGPAPAASKGA